MCVCENSIYLLKLCVDTRNILFVVQLQLLAHLLVCDGCTLLLL